MLRLMGARIEVIINSFKHQILLHCIFGKQNEWVNFAIKIGKKTDLKNNIGDT